MASNRSRQVIIFWRLSKKDFFWWKWWLWCSFSTIEWSKKILLFQIRPSKIKKEKRKKTNWIVNDFNKVFFAIFFEIREARSKDAKFFCCQSQLGGIKYLLRALSNLVFQHQVALKKNDLVFSEIDQFRFYSKNFFFFFLKLK